jgi:type IV pilus assembly protein PilB
VLFTIRINVLNLLKYSQMPINFNDNKNDQKINDLLSREEADLARMLSGRYGIPFIDLSDQSINTNALRLIPEERARAAGIAAFDLQSKKISLAIRTPNKQEVDNEIKDLERRGYFVQAFMTTTGGLEKAWDRYGDISFATETKSGTLEVSSQEIEKFIGEVQTVEDARSLINEIMGMKKSFRISRIVEIVVAAAMATKSSDIHVEPEEEQVVVRFRIDGVLIEVTKFDFDTYKLLLSRIKLLSGLKLNIKNDAQDGRFSVKIGENEIEIRSSVLPGNHGESIVMRLLDPSSLVVSMEDLGVPEYLVDIFKEEVDKPHGMILNTGPTGSGKTTTLYSFLGRKKGPGIKIITIEDPIEYHLSGIVQTQVDRKKGYDFAKGLRSSLRQDPDVIMVGEIRDHETAETAVQAALTGHLVFSTLHTNTAAGAFPRLTDLGLNSRILITAISMVIGQRLARKVCPDCKKEVPVEEPMLGIMKSIYDSLPEKLKPAEFKGTQFVGQGCEKCNKTGYKGRIGIFEVVVNNEEIENAVINDLSQRQIQKIARDQGLLDMAQDGLIKIMNGVTDFNEVNRVVDMERREGKMDIKDPDEV